MRRAEELKADQENERSEVWAFDLRQRHQGDEGSWGNRGHQGAPHQTTTRQPAASRKEEGRPTGPHPNCLCVEALRDFV